MNVYSKVKNVLKFACHFTFILHFILHQLRETHQGVMTDRRHSLKRGDRLSKKERQTTASGLGKSDKLRFVLWVKSDSDIYYNKTSDKEATKLVTSDLGYTLGGPLKMGPAINGGNSKM
jgi:hypothetical protein